MANTMRAVVVRAPMQFAVEDVPVPECPPGGFLLRIIAAGLCGSDLRTLRHGHSKVTFPWIIGHEIAGEVVELDSAYQGPWQLGEVLAIGPNTYCGVCDFCRDGRFEYCENHLEIAQQWPGGLAEYIAIPEEAVRLGTIHRLPEGLDPIYASVSEPMSSVVNSQEQANVGLGDTVMVIGSGPIGCAQISLAKARGADAVFIADIVQDKLDLARPFGPDAMINVGDVDVVEEVRRLTGGKGPTVVITATPAPIAVVQAVEMARKTGRILVFGGLPKDNSKPPVDMNIVHYNALHLIGITAFGPRHQRQALELLASGKLPGDKLVTHRFPLDDFVKGANMALEGKVLKSVYLP